LEGQGGFRSRLQLPVLSVVENEVLS